jgi:hypothetical protein
MSINTNHTNDTLTPSTGGMAVAGLICSEQAISVSFTLPTGYNAMMAGPVTINTGITVTVPTGARFVVV